MNWNISVNNALAWNTVGGKTFTSSDGLNTTSYTQISFSFVCPSTTNFNLHVGSHLNTSYGQSAQIAGTSYVYGWQILVKGAASTLTSNLTVDGTMTTTGTLFGPTGSFSSLTTSGGASIAGTLTGATGSFTSLTVGGNGVPTKLSGSFSATTTFQTIYTITSPQYGIIRVVSANTSYPSMMIAMFELTNTMTYTSLTLLASSGNAAQAAINTTNTGNGPQYISLQLAGANIQVKTTANMNVTWYVTIL